MEQQWRLRGIEWQASYFVGGPPDEVSNDKNRVMAGFRNGIPLPELINSLGDGEYLYLREGGGPRGTVKLILLHPPARPS